MNTQSPSGSTPSSASTPMTDYPGEIMQEDEQCGSKYTCHSDLCWIIALAEPFKLLLNRREDYQNFNNWDKNYLLKLTGKESIQLHILLSSNLIMILSLNYKSIISMYLYVTASHYTSRKGYGTPKIPSWEKIQFASTIHIIPALNHCILFHLAQCLRHRD